MRLGGPQSRSRRHGEVIILDPTGTRTPTSVVQPVASRYTDCAIPAHDCLNNIRWKENIKQVLSSFLLSNFWSDYSYFLQHPILKHFHPIFYSEHFICTLHQSPYKTCSLLGSPLPVLCELTWSSTPNGHTWEAAAWHCCIPTRGLHKLRVRATIQTTDADNAIVVVAIQRLPMICNRLLTYWTQLWDIQVRVTENNLEEGDHCLYSRWLIKPTQLYNLLAAADPVICLEGIAVPVLN
jgi:hypothetical protein